MKVMFFVLPMIFGGLCAPFAAVLTKKFGARIICTLFSFLGTCAWLAGVYFGQNTDSESLEKLKIEWETQDLGDCVIRGEMEPDVSKCILVKKLWQFLTCITIAGLFHGGVLVNAPVEVNRWVESKERGFWNAVVWSGSSVGALWIAPTFKHLIDVFDGNWMNSLLMLVSVQGFVLFMTSLVLIEPPNDDLQKQNEVTKCSFKHLWKIPIFKAYLGTQMFYAVWRSGAMNYLVNYAEVIKNFEPVNAAFLVTYMCLAEMVARPIFGKISDKHSRYALIGGLFIIQSILTISITSMNTYWSFTAVVSLMGLVQGGAGGMFMTAVVDAVGVNHARYAYSIENMLDVFVCGFATQLYGNIGDKFFRTPPMQTTLEFVKNGTFTVIDEGVEKVELDYVYHMAGVCIFIAGLLSYRGYCLEMKQAKCVDNGEGVGGFESGETCQDSV